MKPLYSLILILLLTLTVNCQIISNYKPYTGWGVCKNNSKEVVVLRKLQRNNHTFYFVLSPQSLDTKIISADSIDVNSANWEKIRVQYASTPYITALQQSEKYNDTIQDAGFKHFRSSQKGIDLTIDLCPSPRPLDRIVFTEIIQEMVLVEKPVPLAISITGRWINKHPKDLDWLDSLIKIGDLSVVWINHSYNHYTSKNVPLKMNFLLAPGTDINAEVLNTEMDLLQRNIVPSIFFRFPGLVSDHNIYDKVLDLGLIPVGCDAWLAKGQRPENGSIVLIHANGNEPLGVKEFINLLKTKRAEVLSKHWVLFDLRESIIDDENK